MLMLFSWDIQNRKSHCLVVFVKEGGSQFPLALSEGNFISILFSQKQSVHFKLDWIKMSGSSKCCFPSPNNHPAHQNLRTFKGPLKWCWYITLKTRGPAC